MSTNNRLNNIELRAQKALENLELSPREIEVFLGLLKAGGNTAADIAKRHRNIPRTSIYDVLTSLQNRGLVSTNTQQDKVYFQAEGIEHIADTLENKKREIDEQQKELRSAADLFNQLKLGSAYKPSVRFFEGKQGIIAIQREIQNAKKPTYTIVDMAAIANKFPSFVLQDNLREFSQFKIPKWDLMIKSEPAFQYLKVAPISETHKVKWLPETVKFHTDTLIWDGHVAILDYEGGPSGVIIDNPAIYKTFLAWFNMMWESTKEEVKAK